MIRRELEFSPGTVVSVVRVVLGPDLKFARIFVSVLPEAASDEVLQELRNKRVIIQQQLVSKLSMKFSPKLSFVLDETESQASRIESLLDEISGENVGKD